MRKLIIFIIALSANLSMSLGQAYTLSQTKAGKNIRWPEGQKYVLSGNTSNATGISAAALLSGVLNGLQQWKDATQGLFDFTYDQGTDPAIYLPEQKYNGVSSIFFASQSTQTTDPNVIGFTQKWFRTETGDLVEADIMSGTLSPF